MTLRKHSRPHGAASCAGSKRAFVIVQMQKKKKEKKRQDDHKKLTIKGDLGRKEGKNMSNLASRAQLASIRQ